MNSKNFDFLRPPLDSLAEEAIRAERYSHNDPSVAVSRLRIFAERAVAIIYIERKLPRPFRADLNDCLQEDVFLRSVSRSVVDKLDILRLRGNKAAHGELFSSSAALGLLREAFEIAKWLHLHVFQRSLDVIPSFTPPLPNHDAVQREVADSSVLQARAAKLEQELALQHQRFEALLAEGEAQRQKLAQAEQIAAVSEASLSRFKAEGERAAKVLGFDERKTRRTLIDVLLRDAGWKVGETGQNTDEVGQEVLLTKIPEEGGGDGYADYVLWDDDGKPLAVIEAKKADKDMELGRVQAWSYANALEKQYGFRPVIFYTNGRVISIWDDVAPEGWDQVYKTTPRRLFGFYSKHSLRALVAKRRRRPLTGLAIDKEIINRLYQFEAPVGKIDHNTYKLFGCENQRPTAHDTLEEVVQHLPNQPGSVGPRFVDMPERAVEGDGYFLHKERVRAVVMEFFAQDPVLLRLKARKPVTEAEIASLAKLILEIDERADLKRLAAHDPVTRGSLVATLRGLVGLDAEAVEAAFVGFLRAHPRMTAKQMQFLARLQEHIAKNGGMELERIFEEPFTQFESLFPVTYVDDILEIVQQFSPLPPSERAS